MFGHSILCCDENGNTYSGIGFILSIDCSSSSKIFPVSTAHAASDVITVPVLIRTTVEDDTCFIQSRRDDDDDDGDDGDDDNGVIQADTTTVEQRQETTRTRNREFIIVCILFYHDTILNDQGICSTASDAFC